MNTVLLGLLAETFIHPGAGQTSGVVDLPVSREAATDYPFIPGSSLKGALREAVASRTDQEGQEYLFGHQEAAGNLLIGDARLLLLPVRSLDGVYKWVTCPHLLERFSRDWGRAGVETMPEVPMGLKNEFLTTDTGSDQKKSGQNLSKSPMFLEERSFRPAAATLDDKWLDTIGDLIDNNTTRKRLPSQLVVVSDDDFVWFARFGLAVQARNVLKTETKTSENLWYEETLPPDTLMYAVLAQRDTSSSLMDALEMCLDDQLPSWLQVGGNETVGQGWFKLAWPQTAENGS